MWWDIVKVSTIQQIKQIFKQTFREHVKLFNLGMNPIPEYFEPNTPRQRRKPPDTIGRTIMALINLHSSKINYPEDEPESYSTIVIVEINKNDNYMGFFLPGNHADVGEWQTQNIPDRTRGETINVKEIEQEDIIEVIRNVTLDRVKTWVKNIKQDYFSIQAHIQSFDKPVQDTEIAAEEE